MNASGFAVIGTPDDVAAQIERLRRAVRRLRHVPVAWATTGPTARRPSGRYELLARDVFPQFQGSAVTHRASRDWAIENRPEFIGAAGAAVMTAMQKHHAEKAEPKQRPPPNRPPPTECTALGER